MNRASKICTVTRIGRLWDAVLGPSCAKSVRSHTDSAWGGGGWGDTIGWGAGGGVGEPRTGIIYKHSINAMLSMPARGGRAPCFAFGPSIKKYV